MRIVSLLLLALAAGSLQGCFPVVAAGVGTGVMMVQDRRTSGAYIDDEAIENKASSQIGKQYKDKVHVNVTSFNRNVLVSGEAPSEVVKAEIGRLVAGVENVRNVSNELVVASPSSLTSRSSDSVVTSDVKLRFMQDKRFSAEHVKVVTENGTVFLMGLVKRAEADAATEIASTTGGVQRVVRLFEYLD
ncbi:BON domain-containing protein [Candidatus Ferrigenium straubiae]|jgi:osmotically-inducible protein OsmY|uniref:BON domain-containing protein n=1 Tax=Candidatus Ferrigenium straubiae TaxID=2919506 RepID=UPI003F4A9A5B